MFCISLCRFFIREYAYMDDLIFGSMDLEAHHHAMFQIKVLDHEVGYTLLHHFVSESVPHTSGVH
jgi:hypothetical protein